MKFLTLNLDIEECDQIANQDLAELADLIVQENYDFILLQEVSQTFDATPVFDEHFIPTNLSIQPTKEDNQALILTDLLEKAGLYYYWAWAVSEETSEKDIGLAILSRHKFETRSAQLNDNPDRPAMVLAAKLDELGLTIANSIYSEYENGLAKEWAKGLELIQTKNQYPIVQATYFSGGINDKTTQLVKASRLDLVSTLGKEEAPSHLLISDEFKLKAIQLVLDGETGPKLACAPGLSAEIEVKE